MYELLKRIFNFFSKVFIYHLFCSNDSIKKRRNMPSIKKQTTRYIFYGSCSFRMTRRHLKTANFYIFEGGWQTDTVATYFNHYTMFPYQCIWVMTFFHNRSFLFYCILANKTLLVSFWKLVSSSTTYGSWLSLYFDGIGSGAIWRGLCNYTSDESQQWVNLKF